jgi:hypothetical protein
MISRVPVSSHGFITLVKVLTSEYLNQINPLNRVELELIDLIDGPVSFDVLTKSENGKEFFDIDGSIHIYLIDIDSKPIGSIKVSEL